MLNSELILKSLNIMFPGEHSFAVGSNGEFTHDMELNNDVDITELMNIYKSLETEKALEYVNKYIDTLTYNVKHTIAGKKVSHEQQERYVIKLKHARDGNTEYFTTEAEIKGVEVDELMNSIIEAGSKWETNLEIRLCKVDALRSYLETLVVDDKNDLVNYILKDIRKEKGRGVYIISNSNLNEYLKDLEAKYVLPEYLVKYKSDADKVIANEPMLLDNVTPNPFYKEVIVEE